MIKSPPLRQQALCPSELYKEVSETDHWIRVAAVDAIPLRHPLNVVHVAVAQSMAFKQDANHIPFRPVMQVLPLEQLAKRPGDALLQPLWRRAQWRARLWLVHVGNALLGRSCWRWACGHIDRCVHCSECASELGAVFLVDFPVGSLAGAGAVGCGLAFGAFLEGDVCSVFLAFEAAVGALQSTWGNSPAIWVQLGVPGVPVVAHGVVRGAVCGAVHGVRQ